jgi:hypothetical protein
MKRKFGIRYLRYLSELDDCRIRISTSPSRLCRGLATRTMSAVRMMAIRPNPLRGLRLRLASNGLPRTIRTAIRARPAHILHCILSGSRYHREKSHTNYPAKMADAAPLAVSHFHWIRDRSPETSSRTEVPLAQYELLTGELPGDLNDGNSMIIL